MIVWRDMTLRWSGTSAIPPGGFDPATTDRYRGGGFSSGSMLAVSMFTSAGKGSR